MDLERERGITIKAHAVRLNYHAADGQDYVLNLIDTPGPRRLLLRGHAIARGLRGRAAARRRVAGRRGADARQRVPRGREQPRDHPGHQQDRPARRAARRGRGARSRRSSASTRSDAILASAKEGRGVAEILEAIVHRLPPPIGDADAPLKALIFDSWYDPYRGVVILTRVIDGVMRPGQKIRLMADRAGLRDRTARRVLAQAAARRLARRRRGRLPRREHQERRRREDRRHDHRDRDGRRRRRSRASRN